MKEKISRKEHTDRQRGSNICLTGGLTKGNQSHAVKRGDDVTSKKMLQKPRQGGGVETLETAYEKDTTNLVRDGWQNNRY